MGLEPMTSAMPSATLYQLSYEATQLRAGQIYWTRVPMKGPVFEVGVLSFIILTFLLKNLI